MDNSLLVPVTITLLIPVKPKGEFIGNSFSDKDNDCNVIDIESTLEQNIKPLEETLNDPDNKEVIQGALDALLSGAMLYKQDYPTARGKLYYFFGLTEPIDF